MSDARVEVVRFRDLAPPAGGADLLLTTERQVRSLMSHPYAAAEDVAGVVLRRGDRTVGRYGLFPGRVRVAGREHRMSWGSDWRVHEDQRGPAAGLLLLRAAREAGTLGGIGPSAAALPLYRASGFQFTALSRAALPLGGKGVASRGAALASGLRLAAGLFAAVQLARAAAAVHAAGLRVRLIDAFTERHDELLDPSTSPSGFPRDHAELNWVLSHPWRGPEDGFRYLALDAIEGDRLVGAALLRVRPRGDVQLGSVLRLAASPDDRRAHALVVAAAFGALREAGADIAEVCTSDRLLLRAARLWGARPRVGMDAVLRPSPEVAAGLRSAGVTLADLAPGIGDGDVIFA